VINGVSFSVQAGTTTLQSFVDQINSQSSVTGVVAEVFVNDDGDTVVRLRSTEYGENFSVDLNDQQQILLNGATSASDTGVNAEARVTLSTIDGGEVFVTFTGGVSRSDSGLRLTDAKGNVLLLTEAGNDEDINDAAVGRTTTGQLLFQIGANAGQVARFSINEKQLAELEAESQAIARRLRALMETPKGRARADRPWSGRFIRPVEGRITSGYGMRNHPIFKVRKMHTGIDIAAPTGTPIRAADAGVVVEAGYIRGYGYTVIIDHGGGVATLYAHCSALLVSAGQEVQRGQIIARVGSTGYSTGPHLHFEVRVNGEPVDPLGYGL
jgi:murein DD-endopeptidase MepM/ murein hydrolase activator NlpD